LEERLKQKAKTPAEILGVKKYKDDRICQIHCIGKCPGEPCGYFKEKWVRLEDVLSILKQLKQNYVLVKIGDLEAIVYTSTKYEGLRDIVDDFCGNYDDVAREAYALGMKDLAKRLLRENDEKSC